MFRGLRKAANRESKHYRRTKGMKIDNRNIFILDKKNKERAEAIRLEKERQEKEQILNEESE